VGDLLLAAWVEGGDFGYPAVVVLNTATSYYAVLCLIALFF
jgi:hypothetical protein